MSDMTPSLPSSEAIGGMINTLMSNPELMKNILGAIGGQGNGEAESTEEKEADTHVEEKKDGGDETAGTVPALSVPPELLSKLPLLLSLLGGGESLPKSKREQEREALLCALKPYISHERAEALEKIIKISRLSDLLGLL